MAGFPVMPVPSLSVVAVLALLLGLVLMLAGRGMRQRRGLGSRKTVSLDKVTLTSCRLGLTGRPDRLVRQGDTVIVEEWKSGRTLRPWHRAQMGAYFLLIVDQLKVKPRHGYIACGDGTRHRIENTAELRDWVLVMADRIREARAEVDAPITVEPIPAQCRPCSMRSRCRQARI